MLCLSLQVITAIALVAITVTQLDYSEYGVATGIFSDNAWAENTCALSLPTASVADSLCTYLYATAAIGLLLFVIITLPAVAVCCGKQSRVWYRGGFYKVAQAFLLFTGFLFWAVLSVYLTIYGSEANSYRFIQQKAWRWTAIALSWLATAFYFAALALRLFDEGGSITRAELDVISSGEKVMEIKNRGYYVSDNGEIKGWGSQVLPPDVLQKKVLRTYERKYQVDGYYPDTKDPRDRIFIPWHPRWYGSWLTLPRMVDLSQFMPQVLDQGALGTCVVNSVALAYRFTVSKDNRKNDFIPSRLFLFFNTKYHVMNEYPDGESGSFTRACCQSLRKYGCCSEQTYPYNTSLVSCEPPVYAYIEAKKHRVSYYVVPQTKYDIYAALSQGHPVMVSISFINAEYDAMGDNHAFPYLNYPDEVDMYTIEHSRHEDEVGHHAICVVGYDKKTDVVKFQNSYGKEWGYKGCFYAPVEYLLHPKLTRDLWIFRKAK